MKFPDIWGVGKELKSGVECPKCGEIMSQKGELLECKHCGYWEGEKHAYKRLMKEGKLG